MILAKSAIRTPALLVAMAAVISNSVFAQTISFAAPQQELFGTYTVDSTEYVLYKYWGVDTATALPILERQPWYYSTANSLNYFELVSSVNVNLAKALAAEIRNNPPGNDPNSYRSPRGSFSVGTSTSSGQNFIRFASTTDENIANYSGIQTPVNDGYFIEGTQYWFVSVLGPLSISPSAVDTFNSFRPNAFALRNAFNLQSANITQSLSYDCTVFDAKNICASFSGTRSNQNGSNLDSTTGTLVIAHRPAANVRFGGYINQSLNTSEQGGLRLERSKPGMGAFVNYALTSGLNIRGSVGFGKLDMQTTREALGTAEAGVGKSNITTQGAQLELSKAFDIKAGWTAVPYAGIRKVTNKRAGYSETASDLVSTPLTFADLKQTQTTAFGGMRFLGQIAQQTQLLISAGVEHDSSRKVDDYAASGIDGLGSITMQENVKKTRPMFATSLSYDIAKNERASIGVVHRQEAFDKKRTTSVGFTYMKGF